MQLPVIQPGKPAPAGKPPIFEKIGIVGLGLIGGSIAMAARQLWPAALVIAVDNKDVLETEMAVPVVEGRKSESEKFAGALRTYSIEALM